MGEGRQEKWETQGPEVINEQCQSFRSRAPRNTIHPVVPRPTSTCRLMKYPSIFFYPSSLLFSVLLSFLLCPFFISFVPPSFDCLYHLASFHPHPLSLRWKMSLEGSDGWIKNESTTPCRLYSSHKRMSLVCTQHTQTHKRTLLPVVSIETHVQSVILLQLAPKNTSISWYGSLLAWCQ